MALDRDQSTLLLAAIGRLRFRFARTMPELPHEYTVRRQAADEADYIALFEAIQELGVIEGWKGRPGPYLYPGDGWRYWDRTAKAKAMLWRSTHINRNRLEEADKLRATGLITPWTKPDPRAGRPPKWWREGERQS